MMAAGAGGGVSISDTSPPAAWLDVAPLLQRAAAAMEPGELLHGDTFSLFEAVSAVMIGECWLRCRHGLQKRLLRVSGHAPCLVSRDSSDVH